MSNAKKTTVTLRVPKILDDKVLKIVDTLGISKNASYVLILNEYFKQQDAIDGMGELMKKVDYLEGKMREGEKNGWE